MIKETKKEWIALCRTCHWSGKRCSIEAEADEAVKNHLKSHSQHQVRVLVTGGKPSSTPPSRQVLLKQDRVAAR